MHRDAAPGIHADFPGEREPLSQELVLLPRQLRIAALHLHVFLRVEAHHYDALHAISVGAHAGDVLRDIDVHAGNHAT